MQRYDTRARKTLPNVSYSFVYVALDMKRTAMKHLSDVLTGAV